MRGIGSSKRQERPYIYFMQDGHCGDVKIGRSIDPERRLWNLQVARPRLRIVGIFREDVGIDERAIHRAFALCRVGGEWFAPVEPLIDFINALYAKSCDVTKMLRDRNGAHVRCAGPCHE